MNILVPNLGSTSLKFQLIEFPSEKVLARGLLERIGRDGGDAGSYREAVEKTLSGDHTVDGVGFKAVHAGPDYRGSFRIEDEFMAALAEYELAAPLHNGNPTPDFSRALRPLHRRFDCSLPPRHRRS